MTIEIPTFDLEDEHGASGPVAGVDEAGRGPLAGPVVAAAVILDRRETPDGLNDSKKLTARRRAALAEEIRKSSIVGVGLADVEEIDRFNILGASLLAMTRAVDALARPPAIFLIDGDHAPRLAQRTLTVVKGDARSSSIAAASIIAKTVRDNIMIRLAEEYPAYDWASNKGYGAPAHLAALRQRGASPHHRASFAPVRAALAASAKAIA